ncbi:hypothetical protein [Candidatus Poriferisodalis sp.]|uniref:hypothetical protein n=1 Tax=Candidatus Poriferisodalis sp. TaxID=3101277 RepID=UPI003B01658B
MWTAHDAPLPINVIDGNHEAWPEFGLYAQTAAATEAAKALRRPLDLGGSIWWAWRGCVWRWAVDFGEPDGARLGALDVLKRDDPHRWWPHADAVAAIDSAWTTSPIVVRQHTDLRIWAPAAVRLPNPGGISDADDLSHDRCLSERAAESTKCATFLTDEPFAERWGELDASGSATTRTPSQT